MREVEYRAWVESEKVLVDVLSINLKDKTVTLPIETPPTASYWWNESTWNLEDVVLLQYTGLVDKNGVEIYEDDVILITNKSYKNKATVEWSVLGVKWVLIYNDLSVYELATWHESVYEVIGNIYENPELIEVNDDV